MECFRGMSPALPRLKNKPNKKIAWSRKWAECWLIFSGPQSIDPQIRALRNHSWEAQNLRTRQGRKVMRLTKLLKPPSHGN
jgi:hypothetical protein